METIDDLLERLYLATATWGDSLKISAYIFAQDELIWEEFTDSLGSKDAIKIRDEKYQRLNDLRELYYELLLSFTNKKLEKPTKMHN